MGTRRAILSAKVHQLPLLVVFRFVRGIIVLS